MPDKTKLRSRMGHALLLIAVLTSVAAAQTFRGTILGTVTDPNGALVAGARVTAKNTSTGLERSATTDDAGNWSEPSLLERCIPRLQLSVPRHAIPPPRLPPP